MENKEISYKLVEKVFNKLLRECKAYDRIVFTKEGYKEIHDLKGGIKKVTELESGNSYFVKNGHKIKNPCNKK